MQQTSLTSRIERELERAGLHVVVEARGDVLTLSGIVDTQQARQAASDIASGLAPKKRIDNDLEVETELPTSVADFQADEPSAELAAGNEQIELAGGEEDPDFSDQTLLTDPIEAPGPSSSGPDDPVESGEETYFPPTDPVVTTDQHGQAQILGGFSASSMDSLEVAPSAEDGMPGDEAIADAIRRELREDAATTDLRIRVVVRQGIVRLLGKVPTLDDADNAESVAARVAGVRELIEELDVEG